MVYAQQIYYRKGIIMFEVNPIKNQLADLTERTQVIRGYL